MQDVFMSLVVMCAGAGILTVLIGWGLSHKPRHTGVHDTRNKD